MKDKFSFKKAVEMRKTSKIVIRPFQTMKEPYAVLKYNNVEIQLEYSALLNLRYDSESASNARISRITNSAIDELKKEIEIDMFKNLSRSHRDFETEKKLKNITHYPLHPSQGEILDCEFSKKWRDENPNCVNECPYGAGTRNKP